MCRNDSGSHRRSELEDRWYGNYRAVTIVRSWGNVDCMRIIAKILDPDAMRKTKQENPHHDTNKTSLARLIERWGVFKKPNSER